MAEHLNPPPPLFWNFPNILPMSLSGWPALQLCNFALFHSLQNVLCLLQCECFQLVLFKHVWCHGGWTTPRLNRLFFFQWMLVDGVHRVLIMDWQEEGDIYFSQSHHCLGVRQLFLETASYLAWHSCWVWKLVSKARFPHIGLKKKPQPLPGFEPLPEHD